MAGTYTCTVRGIGGQSSGNSILEVYCKYYSRYTDTKQLKNIACMKCKDFLHFSLQIYPAEYSC